MRLSRKPKLTPHQRREAIQRRDAGDETVREIAHSCNVHGSTISRPDPADKPNICDGVRRDLPRLQLPLDPRPPPSAYYAGSRQCAGK